MTEKLYYTDSYLFEFEAQVLKISKQEKFTIIELDKTAFFPEGGGQQADTGYIGNCSIYDTLIFDDIIYHYTKDTPDFGENTSVFCRIDGKKRFSRMQAHSGEHIVSGIANSLYGANNVGFHMDDTLMTVDFDIPLSDEQIATIEKQANECVYKNLKITSEIKSPEEAEKTSYRSKLEFTGDVRLVEIDTVDICACCAPHVNLTGEIGLIKILTSVSHRGGVRLTVLCGSSAFDDYVKKHNSTLSIAASLCAKHYETDSAVRRLIDANAEQKYKTSENIKQLLKIIADTVEPDTAIVRFFELPDAAYLRELTNEIRGKSEIFTMLFSGNDEKGYSYCIYSEKLDLTSFIKDFNKTLDGNGGGRGVMLQGRTKATKEQINNYITNLRYTDYENEKKKES